VVVTTAQHITNLSPVDALDVTIRSATVADLTRIAELDDQLYPIEGGWSLEDFEEDFSTDGRLYLVAVSGNEIVGYSACAIDDGVGELTMNTVVPAWRGRGIGRLLLEARLQWLDQRVADVYLQTRVDNEPVLRTYTSYGFTRSNLLVNYYGAGVDAVEMRRQHQS
jgi:ribosomal-protein-alanine N-acetyltransferase